MKKFVILSFLFLIFVSPVIRARAQDETPPGPVYIVSEGDTLSSIALRFGVTVDDLVITNGLPDANSLFIGDRLVIPGLQEISGRLETSTVPFGENARSLSRINQIPLDMLAKLNRLVGPGELHRGASLVLTRGSGLDSPYRISMPTGQSLLETAVRSGTNPWELSEWNGVHGPIEVVPGDILLMNQTGDEGPMGLPRPISATAINPIYQGEAVSFRLSTTSPINIYGSLGPYELNFVQADETSLVSLQGVNALLEPGMYPIRITTDQPDGSSFEFVQLIRVFPKDYIFEYINVSPELIDPETTKSEQELIRPYLSVVTPEKQWSGLFQPPSPFEDCINSTYGNRRSYNGSAFTFYHAGVDYCGGTGVNIFAPADGTVVFTGLLDIRGNLTIIDHGWGIFTAYLHQSEVFVSEGNEVKKGEIIGLVGNTGRSTGPHLHWEVWVNGVPVNPLDWLVERYP